MTVVTATRRLARHFRLMDDQHHLTRGEPAWLPLDVLPWEAWVERQWRAARDRGNASCDYHLLTTEQERIVWEQVMRDLPADLPGIDTLLLPAQAAREAMQAWALTRDYAIAGTELAREARVDTGLFLRIAERFVDLRRHRGWAVAADLVWQLAGVADSLGDPPRHLLFAGFDGYTPAQQHLFERLRAAGHQVIEWTPRFSKGRGSVIRGDDPDSELRAAAQWVAQMIRARPEASIGLVVLDLDQRRSELVDVLEDTLDPGAVLPHAVADARPWNLSLGLPLSRWPLVDNALLGLALWLGKGSHTELGRLLRSPYLGEGITEAGPRAQLDVWLRHQGVYQLDLAGLFRLTATGTDARRPAVPALHGRLEQVQTCDATRMQSFDGWAESFRRVLAYLGWPGDRSLDSAEYQTVSKWQELLARLAGLTAVSSKVSASTALEQARRMAADSLFQPETPPAPVQVLGLMETPGLVFDAVWVAGLHDQAWPRPLRPNALLPVGLQREAGMPRSGAKAELEFAVRRTAALGQSGSEVVFSWPLRDQDEVLRPSSLLTGLPSMDPEPEQPGLASIIQLSSRLESLDDTRIRPWPVHSRLRGGSGVLRAQSACPFQAQARYRLYAEPVETPMPGIAPLVSGELAHLALHGLWQQWVSPEVPRAMASADLQQAVRDALAGATRQVLGGARDIPPSMLELEQERLSQRILELLREDLDRESFAIEALESEQTEELAGLGFRLRIDRIDRLTTGKFLYIDYKTGNSATGDWLGERPREPQLPLYAMAGGSQVAGVAFGSLAAGEVGYCGFAESDIPGTAIRDPGTGRRPAAEDWSALLAAWRQQLSVLAQGFADGDARVDPRRVSEDCRRCDLSVLCRRHELSERGALGDD